MWWKIIGAETNFKVDERTCFSFQPRREGVIRCDKEWQRMMRCYKKSGAWELILNLPNDYIFLFSLGDKVW